MEECICKKNSKRFVILIVILIVLAFSPESVVEYKIDYEYD
jgi:hypothetical protein